MERETVRYFTEIDRGTATSPARVCAPFDVSSPRVVQRLLSSDLVHWLKTVRYGQEEEEDQHDNHQGQGRRHLQGRSNPECKSTKCRRTPSYSYQTAVCSTLSVPCSIDVPGTYDTCNTYNMRTQSAVEHATRCRADRWRLSSRTPVERNP